MSRAYIDRLRAARRAVTGHKPGTAKTTWKARPGDAAGPEPVPVQATVEAWLAHVSYGPGAMTHPLGYVGLTAQRWYTQSRVTPHADQLVIESSAPDNWIQCLIGWNDRAGRVVETGASRLVVGFDDDSLTGWTIGPENTAVVLVAQQHGRRGSMVELEKLSLPARLADLAADNPPIVQEHPTDRMMSALVRRFVLTDKYLSPHDFFSFDGHLGIEFQHGRARDELSPDHPCRALGFETAGDLIEGCLVDHFLGIPDVTVAARTEEWVAVEDQRNGAWLLLRWRRP
jgi:hypothetical protein